MRRVTLLLPLALIACEREPRDPSDYPAECPANTQWDGAHCVRTDVIAPTPTDPIAGSFTVTGVRHDGKPYEGTAEVVALGAVGPYRFTWTLSGNTFSGIGTKRGDLVSVGWADGPKDFGVVDFVASGDGTLDGLWYDATSSSPGREVLTGGLSNLAGAYTIQKGIAPNHSTYTGTCDLAVTGDLHTLIWHIGKDTFRGLGVREGDVLSVGFSTTTSGNFGVVQYKLKGNELVGRWAEWSQKVPTLGSETLVKK
jgi:hypothetical protein